MPALIELFARQKAAVADDADPADMTTTAAAPSYSMSAEGIAITWGMLLGGVAAIAAVIAVLWWFCFRKKYQLVKRTDMKALQEQADSYKAQLGAAAKTAV